MYFSVFSSYEYYEDKDNVNTDDVCLICWLPTEETNKIKLLSNFLHINPNCKCNPKIHSICINEWIKKSQSCPICRTKINIIMVTSDKNNMFVNYYIIFMSYTIYFLRILCYISFVNLLCLFLYNAYYMYIYIMTNKFYKDDYDIY